MRKQCTKYKLFFIIFSCSLSVGKGASPGEKSGLTPSQHAVVAVDDQSNGNVQPQQREQYPERVYSQDIEVCVAPANQLMPACDIKTHHVHRGHVHPLPEQHGAQDTHEQCRQKTDRVRRVQHQ